MDDLKGLLGSFVPAFVVATDGKAGFLWYDQEHETAKQLINRIMELRVDVLLLDYYLTSMDERPEMTPGLTGASIAEALVARGFAGTIVGFSSEKFGYEAFAERGLFAIMKGAGDENVARIIAELESLVV